MIGLIAIQDARASSKRSDQKAQRTGLENGHVNGDNERVAQAIAKQEWGDTVIAMSFLKKKLAPSKTAS